MIEPLEPIYISCLSKDIIKIYSRILMLRLWLIAILGFLLIVAGIFTDIRASVIGLMLIFIIMPMAVLMSVLKCLGSKWSTVNLTPKTVHLSPEGIKMTPAEGYKLPVGDISWDDVREISMQRQSYILRVGRPVTDSLILPASLLSDEEKSLLDSRMTAQDAML